MKKRTLRERHEFSGDDPDTQATLVLVLLSQMDEGERLRVISSVLMGEVEQTGHMEMVVGTDEHEYTITVVRREK